MDKEGSEYSEKQECGCDICGKKVDDPIQLGTIYEKSGLRVHYYCVLLSTHIQQKGVDSSGILGFLISDIKKEIKEAQNRKCIYCDEFKASIKCYKCPDYFHLLCGLLNNALNQFSGQFKSYCHKHTDIPVELRPHDHESVCRICFQHMLFYNPIKSIKADCCNYGWLHAHCLKKYVLNAGYYTKCLWCKNYEFRDAIRLKGIFVPDRDATWELDKKMFSDMHKRYSQCDVQYCLSTKGRRINIKNSSKWKILVCNMCGSSGAHKICFDKNSNEYTCPECLDVFNTKILTQNVATCRTLVNNHLEITTQSFREVDSPTGKLDRTMYVSKFIGSQNNFGNIPIDTINHPIAEQSPNAAKSLNVEIDICSSSEENCKFDNDDGLTETIRLFKWDVLNEKVHSSITAKVKNSNQLTYDPDEISIISEDVLDYDGEDVIDYKILDECIEEMRIEYAHLFENKENVEEIQIDDDSDDCMKSNSQLLNDMFVKDDVKVPKPLKN